MSNFLAESFVRVRADTSLVKQEVETGLKDLPAATIKVDVPAPDTTKVEQALIKEGAKAGASAGAAAGKEFDKAFASSSTKDAKSTLLQRSGIADMLASSAALKQQASATLAELQRLERGTTTATRGATALGTAIRGIGGAALIYGVSAAASTLTAEFKDADGALGGLARTLDGIKSFDLAATFDGVADILRDLDEASGGFLTTLKDGLVDITNAVIPGLGDAVDGLLRKFGGVSEEILKLRENAKQLTEVSVLPTSQNDITAQTRALLRERQLLLRRSLGINDPEGPQFSAAGRDRQRQQFAARGGDINKTLSELAQVTKALGALNRPLPVQIPQALQTQLAVAQAGNDVQGQRAAIARIQDVFERALKNPRLTPKQVEEAAVQLARFNAQLEALNRQQDTANQPATDPTPFGFRRQADLAVARARGGPDNTLIEALQDRIAIDDKQIAQQEALLKRGGKNAGAHAETLKRLYGDRDQALGEIQSIQAAAQREAERLANEALRNATKAQQELQARIRRQETALQNDLTEAIQNSPNDLDRQKQARAALVAFYKQETRDSRILPEEQQRYYTALLATQQEARTAQAAFVAAQQKATADALRSREAQLQDAFSGSLLTDNTSKQKAASQALIDFYTAAQSNAKLVATEQDRYRRALIGERERQAKERSQVLAATRELRETTLQNDVAAAGLTENKSAQKSALLRLREFYVQIQRDAGAASIEGQKARAKIIGVDRELKGLTKDTQRVIVQGVLNGVDLIVNTSKEGADQVRQSFQKQQASDLGVGNANPTAGFVGGPLATQIRDAVATASTATAAKVPQRAQASSSTATEPTQAVPAADPAAAALSRLAAQQAEADRLVLQQLRAQTVLLQRLAGGGPPVAIGGVATVAGSLTGAQGRAWAMAQRGLNGDGGQ